MSAAFVTCGQVEMRLADRLAEIGHPRQRCVLAVLLYEVNHCVPADQLIERVWADEATASTRATLHTYISRLRKALARAPEVRISRRTNGYVLMADPLCVDVHRSRRLITQANAADDEVAMAFLAEAVDITAGEFCAGLDTPWLASVRTGLEQQRATAESSLVDLKLRRGQHTDVLAELSTRAAQKPLDERVAGQFMVALTRCGRQAAIP
ncbi:AfsR/SARP family transcriptional regulator [Amycolatopsis lurida]